MHFDPVGSEETSSADRGSFDTEDLAVPEDATTRPAREGLPKRFRMRHGRHYVDELLGETPLRTVREIPISEIEPPSLEVRDEAFDLEPLEESIRRLGVLEPLLVIRRGLEYRVVAGMRRLRAARTVGVSTVPCLVQDIDEEKAMEIRAAVTSRLVTAVPITPVAPPNKGEIEETRDVECAEPQLSQAIEPGFRRKLFEDLAAVESLREKIASASRDMLSRPMTIDRSPTLASAIMADAVSAVALEARLRGVRVDIVGVDFDAQISLDAARCRTVCIGLLQGMLALVEHDGATLEVHVNMTSVRPALIVECRLVHDGREQLIAQDDALVRFFDADWEGHPCGTAGAHALGALFRVARAHGGRVQATPTVVTVVIPKLLTEW